MASTSTHAAGVYWNVMPPMNRSVVPLSSCMDSEMSGFSFCPPLTVTEEALIEACDVLDKAVDDAVAELA